MQVGGTFSHIHTDDSRVVVVPQIDLFLAELVSDDCCVDVNGIPLDRVAVARVLDLSLRESGRLHGVLVDESGVFDAGTRVSATQRLSPVAVLRPCLSRVDETDADDVHFGRAIDSKEFWVGVGDEGIVEAVSLVIVGVGLVVHSDFDLEHVWFGVARHFALD